MINGDNSLFFNETAAAPHASQRIAAIGTKADVLAEIFEDNTHIAIWRRHLNTRLTETAARIAHTGTLFVPSMTVAPATALRHVSDALDADESCEFARDVASLVEMFCFLLGVERAFVRLTALSKAMCPKFHVDQVTCRLITTYQGAGTEWLAHQHVDRSKLGTGSRGRCDAESGLYPDAGLIQQINAGDVALFKGESWIGNAGFGAVHRSPAVTEDEP
ncbi:MAG: DUF1826 domain-containing protein, partial [Pseudomonadota bacterium]